MQWNPRYNLKDKHAFLSASNYHWLNYDPDKLQERWCTAQAAVRGTKLHELAHLAINLGQRMGRSRQTINLYVNDGIGFRMRTEQVLYYSENCFGTADTISFRKNVLRISDLKTGINKTHMNQLVIYAALFCLEYRYKPDDISIELRIYKNDDVELYIPETQEVYEVMRKITEFNELIENYKALEM